MKQKACRTVVGLSRPSTPWLSAKTWMPGPRPGMTVLLLALRKSKML